MTHWRKEIRKEADKNVREHERDTVMGYSIQEFRAKFLAQGSNLGLILLIPKCPISKFWVLGFQHMNLGKGVDGMNTNIQSVTVG